MLLRLKPRYALLKALNEERYLCKTSDDKVVKI